MSRTSQAEAALEDHLNVSWSPEAPVQSRIQSFNILKRLEMLDQIAEADFELEAA